MKYGIIGNIAYEMSYVIISYFELMKTHIKIRSGIRASSAQKQKVYRKLLETQHVLIYESKAMLLEDYMC